jgi:spore maturation protein A
MLNSIWAGMILIGIVWGTLHGQISSITEGILSGAEDAVNLCISLLGILSFWSGMMQIAEESGFLQKLSHRLGPFLDFLFPEIPKNHPAREHISANIVANVLGLGWAATPSGLEAIKQLQQLNKNSEIASNSMCAFLILNISSLQLIPINVIAYRNQYGSVNPTAIVAPAIVATTISTITAIVFIRFMMKVGNKF